MDEKPLLVDYAMQEVLYQKFEPYHYFEIYLGANATLTKNDEYNIMKAYKNPDAWLNQRNFSEIGTVCFADKDCKIVQIDEDLIPLLEDTTPNFEELKMPYPAMFINKQFKIGNFIINGFLLVDLEMFRNKGIEIRSDMQTESQIRILSLILNTKGKYEFYSLEPLIAWKKSETRKHFFDSEEEHKDMVKGAKLINRMGANLINIIINDTKDIELATVTYSKEQNIKRLKKGKPKHRDKLVIRLGGKLKIYAKTYHQHRGEIQVRFLVRGFWRHFRSGKYKNKIGTKKWIYPYYKGQDRLIELNYKKVELKCQT